MIRLNSVQRWSLFVALVLWAIIVIFPLYWMVTTTFKLRADIYAGPALIPWVDFVPTLEHWARVVARYQQVTRAMANSAVAGLASAAAATFIGGMAGYGLTRFQYKLGFLRNRDIAFWILSNRVLPPIVLVLPIFIMFRTAGLVDSRAGLAIVYTMFNLPIAAWLMLEYFKQIPIDLDESAKVDGATYMQILTRIALPLARPGIIATFLVCLMFAWNEFIYALILTFSRAQTLPLVVAGQATQHGPQWWDIAVMATITIAPLLLVTILLGNRLIAGLTAGWGQ